MQVLQGAYDVSFDSLAKGSADSVPIGNGDIGANVWVAADGVYLYASKTDAWDENGRLVKLGKVKLAFSPNPFVSGSFRQTLRLADACIVIEAGDGFRLEIWADANHPAIRFRSRADAPMTVQASIEPWRSEARELPPEESHFAIGPRSPKECSARAPRSHRLPPKDHQWCPGSQR